MLARRSRSFFVTLSITVSFVTSAGAQSSEPREGDGIPPSSGLPDPSDSSSSAVATSEVPPGSEEPVEVRPTSEPRSPAPSAPTSPKPSAPAPQHVGLHLPGGCANPPNGTNILRPVWIDYDGIDAARVGYAYMYEPQARDPEGRPLTYQITESPEGARIEWFRHSFHPCDDTSRPMVQELRPRIYWTPRPYQRGVQEVRVLASDGQHKVEKVRQIEVRDDWEGFFLPGASYTLYAPRGDGQGLYHGPAFEMLIGAWIHRNEKPGPSDGRVYASIGLLQSSEQPDAVTATLGFDLSIERHPKRSFLIPFFGLEAGGFFRQGAPSAAQFTPFVGVHAYADRNLFVNLSGGYLFPTARIDDLLGYTGRLSVNFSLW